MAKALRVAVIGVGGTGSAACRHLARAGHRVVGYEQFALGHDRGSSHGESRVIRYAYHDRLYTEMMGDAYPLWEALQAEAGEELLVRCGGVTFGPAEHPEMRATEDALRAAGVPCQLLSAAAFAERQPALRLRPGENALLQSDAGFLRAASCVRAHARLARAEGATIHENAPVAAVRTQRGEVILQMADGAEEAFDRAIVTAGAWMGKLLSALALPLKVTRQQFVYLAPADPAAFSPDRFSVWIDAVTYWYGFPADGRIEGVKLAWHGQSEPWDPDRPERPVDPAEREEAIAYAAERLPLLAPPPLYERACLYTNTPDEDFIIDAAPGLPGVLLVSGCSGHGFKFTALLGKIAADLTAGESYPRDLSRFRLSRFALRPEA